MDDTDITVLVDRSGSMYGIARDMEGALNSFTEEQSKKEGRCTYSLYSFDWNDYFRSNLSDNELWEKIIQTHYEGVAISDVGKFRLNARGRTPLFDALGLTINRTGDRLSNLQESERPQRVIFVTITDGMENSSCNYTRKQISQMVKHQEEVYNWCFIYFGANQNAIKVAEDLGMHGSSAMDYDADSLHVIDSGRVLNEKVNQLRACSFDRYDKMSKGKIGLFSAEDRKRCKS